MPDGFPNHIDPDGRGQFPIRDCCNSRTNEHHLQGCSNAGVSDNASAVAARDDLCVFCGRNSVQHAIHSHKFITREQQAYQEQLRAVCAEWLPIVSRMFERLPEAPDSVAWQTARARIERLRDAAGGVQLISFA